MQHVKQNNMKTSQLSISILFVLLLAGVGMFVYNRSQIQTTTSCWEVYTESECLDYPYCFWEDPGDPDSLCVPL